MSVQIMSSTAQRFNSIRWHDSKLLDLSFHRSGGEEVKMSLELLGEGGAHTAAEIIFKESAYIEADVYLDAKAMCADDISDAECHVSSEWKDTVSQPGPYDPILGNRHFEQHLHFAITLCPPGGRINILAKDFSVEFKAPGIEAQRQ